ncbi:putative ABC transport system permease protein [Catalinimonas alkaloidigena]|uniref:ABC transporter permease n=1 Tax=Catalinimonas alkaloidigena TaxID=1075417 RepID=UPI0024068F35|nr:ABC transporter permease [Catalinimonas alkaloidigena]MDF9795790.1 putative ABC transport system permease protein [Catalinimonas alkaloidigena]
MNEKIVGNFSIALEAILANKLRSFLTALGIIFGVAAVIAMLGIGAGAQEEILEQIKLVGVNNIIVQPVVEQTEEEVNESSNIANQKPKFSPGLTMLDVNSIQEIIPGISTISPEIIMDKHIIKNGIRRSAKLVGVEKSYFGLANFRLGYGEMFSAKQIEEGEPVCIIGKSIEDRFFSEEDPLNKMIKVGNQWLKVIGVLERRLISQENINRLGIRDYNMDVYVPISTMLIRYRDRSLITQTQIQEANSRNTQSDDTETTDEEFMESRNYHQLDRLVIRADETESLSKIADVLSRMLQRRHFGVVDYEIAIPELLIKQQQRTNQIFNFVLGALAGISLLVGGIGIMNIMLASVMERIKEIGLRLAVGAQKSDIILQFLFEAMLISLAGGLIGVILGMLIAMGISNIADIPTVITLTSIMLSFGVAATVGLIFGIAPARKAANQDPITSLRYE